MIVAQLVGKQRRSVELATARQNIWEGSVSSSKTICSLIKWIEFVREAPPGPLLMVAKTERTLKRNIIDVLVSMLGKKRCQFVAGVGELHILGRLVYVAGANNELAVDKIRGLSLAGAYLDEASTVPKAFYSMLLTRLRIPGAKLFATSNPDGPAHWLKVDYLDRAALHLNRDNKIRTRVGDSLNLHRFSFAMADNPTLDPDYIADTTAEQTGLFYRRLVLGEWCLAEGVVYRAWDPARHIVKAADIPPITSQLAIGIDHGTTNPLHALMLGLGADGRLYVTHEWRWDHKHHTEGQITNVEYSQRLRAWATEHKLKPRWTVIDPSAGDFKLQMHRDGWAPWDADNEVVPGIQQIASLFATGRLLVSDACPGLIAEIPGYAWDPKASEKGHDQPIKVADHACLVAGTPVMTDAGPKPIETIGAGDLVLTREGMKTVIASGMTSASATVHRVETSDGRTLTGTGNHPVWVESFGWKRLDTLRYADKLVSCRNEPMSLCSKGSSSADTPTPSSGPNAPTTSPESPIANAAPSASTKRSGWPPTTAPSLKATTSTTPTATRSTTTRPTSHASPQLNTSTTTVTTGQVNAHPNCWPTLTASAPWPVRGTAPKPDGHGTSNTVLALGRTANPTNANAASAAQPTTPDQSAGTSASAPTPANQPTAVLPASTTSRGPVGTAETTSPSTGTPRPSAAPVHVLRVTAMPSKQAVWNLTVADCPEYFAAGVLVHNCDAMRYAVHTTEPLWFPKLTSEITLAT